MKQNVSPAVFLSIIAVAVIGFGIFMWRVWLAPSSVPAPGTENKKIVPPGGAIPPEGLRARDEWRRTHPEGATK